MAVDSWTTDQVLAMLDQLGLSHVKQPFRDNGVNGRVLASLDETELRDDLGLTHLQAKNVMMHLRSLGAYGFQPTAGPVAGAPMAAAAYGAPYAGTATMGATPAQAGSPYAAAAGAGAMGAASAATQITQANMQASNLLRNALGELQQAEAILQKDKHLAGGMLAANVIAGPEVFGRHRGFGRGIGGGIGHGIDDRRNLVTVMASVGEKRNAEAADRLVQAATSNISQAEQLTDVPQINPAVVQSLRGGVYMNIIGVAFSQVVVRSKLQQSLASLRTMMTQVRSALDWLSRPRAGVY